MFPSLVYHRSTILFLYNYVNLLNKLELVSLLFTNSHDIKA